MLDLVVISILVLLVYFFVDCGHYRASPGIHIFGTIVPILVFKYGTSEVWPRRFLFMIIAWHVVDILNHAIDDGLKNQDSNQCTSTVSTWNADPTDGPKFNKNLTEKDSPSSSSGQQMAESKPQMESTPVPPNTDVL